MINEKSLPFLNLIIQVKGAVTRTEKGGSVEKAACEELYFR